ncbi:hypothetical protein FRC12_018943, partial [Ceratobasidium sp. 428]
CKRLNSVLNQPGAREWSKLEESLVYVDSVLGSLDSWSSHIQDARAILGAARNQSKLLVPLNKLPTETIVYVLTLVNTGCIINNKEEHQPSSLAYNVSAVSKPLRDIACSASSLWTHIDLTTGGPQEAACMEYARFCLRYSREQSLSVHIVDNASEYRSKGVISLLAPHAHRIASASFHLFSRLAVEVILGLFSHVTSSRIRAFCLNDCDCDPCSVYTSPSPYNKLFDGRLDKFLEPLQVITIGGPSLSLQSVAFRSLSVLKLSVCDDSTPAPTLLQLTNTLAACPELRVLALICFRFTTYTNAPTDRPVLLPKLELLDLRQRQTGELLTLLSCIAPGSGALALSLWIEPYMSEDEKAKLRHFISLSNVTRLYIESTSLVTEELEPQPLPLLPYTFPVVQELALGDYDLAGFTPECLLDAKYFPSLHTLHMLHCFVDSYSWRQILDSSAIQLAYADDFSIRELSELSA